MRQAEVCGSITPFFRLQTPVPVSSAALHPVNVNRATAHAGTVLATTPHNLMDSHAIPMVFVCLDLAKVRMSMLLALRFKLDPRLSDPCSQLSCHAPSECKLAGACTRDSWNSTSVHCGVPANRPDNIYPSGDVAPAPSTYPWGVLPLFDGAYSSSITCAAGVSVCRPPQRYLPKAPLSPPPFPPAPNSLCAANLCPAAPVCHVSTCSNGICGAQLVANGTPCLVGGTCNNGNCYIPGTVLNRKVIESC